MDPTNPLAVEVSKLRPIWFSLVQNETPEGLDRAQTEQELIEFAKELVVMEKIKPEEVQAVLAEENYNQRIIDLIELVTKGAYSVKDENFNSRLQALVSKYKEHQKIVAAAKEKEAQAMIAKHHKPGLREEIKVSFDNLKKQVAEQDKESLTSAYLEESEGIEPQLALTPVKTAQLTDELVQATSTIKDIALPQTISPLVRVVAELDPHIETLLKVVTQKVEAAVDTLSPAGAGAAADEFVALEVINSNASRQEVEKLAEKIILNLEKEGHLVSDTLAKEVGQLLEDFDLDAPLPEKIEQTIALELQQQTDLDPATASKTAKLFVSYRIPELAYHASTKAVSGKTNETPAEKLAWQRNRFTEISNAALQSAHLLPSPALNQLLKKDVNFGNVFYILQKYGPPTPATYEEKNYQFTDAQGRAQDNPVIKDFQAEIQKQFGGRSKDESLQTIDRLKSELQTQTPSQSNNATLQELDRIRTELLNQVPGQTNNATLRAIRNLESELLKQVPSEEIYQSRDRERRPESHPVTDRLRDEIQERFMGRVKNEAWQALDGWINGSAATATVSRGVVGTAIGAAIVPASTALVSASTAPIVGILITEAQLPLVWAGVNAALTSGQLVFAGILPATGELMFVAPASLATAQALITTTGGTLSTTAGATVAGTVAGGIIGAAIAAVVTWIAVNSPKIWKWIMEHGLKPLVVAAAAIVGALLGPLLGLGTLLGGGLGALIGGGVALAAPSTIATFTAGGVQGVIQPIGGFASHVFASVTELAVVSIATPIIIIIMSIPIVVALLLFIINTSAYVVPPSFGGSFGPSGLPYTGPLPAGCPQGWPLDSGYITQGAWVSPFDNPGTYHADTEALDMHATVGTPVKATHTGVVINKIAYGGGYGNYVDLLSTCEYNGQTLNILSRYAHLSSFALPANTLVQSGELIAYSGGSGGYDNQPHLHYEFRRNDLSFSHTHYEENVAPFMWPNFIPAPVRRGCVGQGGCNTPVP